MKILKTLFLLTAIICLSSCASGYKMIHPKSINYISTNEKDGIKLEYKYDLLEKKYEKKELKKGVKLVAVKITNNSKKSITLGRNAKLSYLNDDEVYVMENKKVFTTLKQSTASYLFYLLLTPLNLYTTETNSRGFQENTSSTPIGLVLGPGITAGNMIAAGSANKKFQTELLDYKINGTPIAAGETKYGLIGIKANSFESLKLKIE